MDRKRRPGSGEPAASVPREAWTAGGRGELAREAGFTILEIMIATAILTVGLVGVLALFPVAIHTGKQIVEKSTSVVIAESVAEAIREGIRNSLRYTTKGGTTHAYFIFKHDGVRDEIPVTQQGERPDKDYYILLPRFTRGAEFSSAGKARESRLVKTFVYPETDPTPNGNGDALVADDDGDDAREELADGTSVPRIKVEKTYSLGVFLPGDEATGENVLDDQKIEKLKQYSYAFSIRWSPSDTNLSDNPARFIPANRLYQVRVMVYSGFQPPGPIGKSVTPAFEFDFEVAL
jgi:type II secretory pathway pseudopilin PulG